MNKKNVSVILCHPSDTFRPPAPSHAASSNELLLIDRKDGSFEIQSIDSSGEPFDISNDSKLCVLSSVPNLAEEPIGMMFRLKDHGGENAIITVMVSPKKAGNVGAFEFQLRTRMNAEGVLTVVPVDPVAGDTFFDADIRSSSPPGDVPQQSTIRQRADKIRVKRKDAAERAKADAEKANVFKSTPPTLIHDPLAKEAFPPPRPLPPGHLAAHQEQPSHPAIAHPTPSPVPAHVPTPIPAVHPAPLPHPIHEEPDRSNPFPPLPPLPPVSEG